LGGNWSQNPEHTGETKKTKQGNKKREIRNDMYGAMMKQPVVGRYQGLPKRHDEYITSE
jgi:hypothetical protein